MEQKDLLEKISPETHYIITKKTYNNLIWYLISIINPNDKTMIKNAGYENYKWVSELSIPKSQINKYNKFEDDETKINDLDIMPWEWAGVWISSLFGKIFGPEITVRFWDFLFAIGVRFIVNYSLAILSYYKKNIMGFKTKADFFKFFHEKIPKKISKMSESSIKNLR